MNVITHYLTGQKPQPQHDSGQAFAPSNIALIKYWGKRDNELNLPVTNSLSMSLGDKGTNTRITVIENAHDIINVDGETLRNDSNFSRRIIDFINLFRNPSHKFKIETHNNIPTAAGLASSASGFAALTLALNDCYGWNFDRKVLSLFARYGSGSACRSVYDGFVEWQKGQATDGSDSYAAPLNIDWPELKIGFLLLSTEPKAISSRQAMRDTVDTSPAYQDWPNLVSNDLRTIKTALLQKDFNTVGSTAEHNAIAMHHTMHQAQPAINYDLASTQATKQAIQQARQDGLNVYFTQDAGPNIKVLFLSNDQDKVKQCFPNIIIV